MEKHGSPQSEARSEQLIAETLRLLSGPDVPAGLEENLLRRVQARRSEPARQTKPRWIAVLRRPMWIGIPLVTAAALVVAVMSHRQRDGVPTAPAMTASVSAPVPASLSPVVSSAHPLPAKEPGTSPRRVREERTPAAAQERMTVVKAASREASFPAPAAPLTEQEKLLLAMARRSEVSSSPEMASLLISETVIQHGLAPEPPLPASSTTSE